MPYRQIQSNLARPILEISWRQGKTWWVLVKSFLLSWIAQKLPQYQSSERAQQHNAELRLKLKKTDNLYHISWLQPRQQKHNASINHCIHLYTIPLRPWLLTKSQESHNIASMDRFESGGSCSRQASQKQEIQPMNPNEARKRLQKCLKGRTKACKNHQ